MRPLRLFPAIAMSVALLALGGCRAPECQQMLECCEEVADVDGIGGGCQLGQDTRDPQTCRDVVRTVGYMLEDRDQSIPAACQQ